MAVTGSLRRLPLITALRSAFLGYCPNCLLGRLFTGLLKPAESCSVCGMLVEHHSESFTMTTSINYVQVCFALVVECLSLGHSFDFYPGLSAGMPASAAGFFLVLHRPVRG